MHAYQVEYSQRYAETNPQAQSLRHLLSEAHLLLRASLLQTSVSRQNSEGGPLASLHTDLDKQAEMRDLEEALRQNCAQLGDCFSRSVTHSHPFKQPKNDRINYMQQYTYTIYICAKLGAS